MTLFLAFLAGILTGLRALTPIAIATLAAHFNFLKVQYPLAWVGSIIAVIIFVLAAIAELVADKLPSTPSRTAPPGMISRILMGGLTGACLASAALAGLSLGALLGICGAVIGAYGGYQLRTRLVKALGAPDYVVAVGEDLLTICVSVWVVTRF
jgi:uncharacterized membrane protein